MLCHASLPQSLSPCLAVEARKPNPETVLNRPPCQCLPQPLGQKQPIVPYLPRWLSIGLSCVAVVEIVAVNLNSVVRINLRRLHPRAFLRVSELRPAAHAVPVFANFFAVVELDLYLPWHDEIFFALQPDVRTIDGVFVILLEGTLLLFVPVHGERFDP